MYSEVTDKLQKKFWSEEHNFRNYEHPVVKYFSQQRINFIEEKIDLSAIESLLDMGCGNGFSTFYLAKRVPGYVVGGDYSQKMLLYHPMKGRVINLDAYHLPFKDNQFDLVNIWEVLHHLENPASVLNEIRRVTKKYVVIFEPNKWHPAQFLLALYEKEHRWVLRFNKKYLFRILGEAGFKNILYYSKGGFIFPNKTPNFLLKILKGFNFQSFLGISQMIIVEK